MRKGFTRKPQEDDHATPSKNYITTDGLQRLTPHRILFRHAANQGLNLGGDLRSTARACTRAPSPVEPEPGSMPAHHGLRLNKDEARCPPRPAAAQDGPEQPVKGAQVRPRMFSFEYRELLTQGTRISR